MLRATEQWKIWFGGDTPSFVQHMLRKQLLLLVSAFIIFFILLLLKKKPSQFYLSMGDLNARVKPVKWLAVQDNIHWKKVWKRIWRLFIYRFINIFVVSKWNTVD